MNILALDLGSTTGYAFGSDTIECGSITWASARELAEAKRKRFDRRGDIRVSRFFDWLINFKLGHPETFVVYEDVLFQSSRCQAQLWSSFRTAVWLAFPPERVETVNTASLKKFATGSGAADKVAMMAAARKAGLKGDFDDNAADAFHLFRWGQQNLSRL